nr:transcriptional regulator FtrA [uncultured Roseateles sp.]
MKNHLVAAVAYDRLCTFEFACTAEVFALPRPELEVDWYRYAVCSPERGRLRSAGGLMVEAPYTLRLLAQADTIVMPGWRDVHEAPPPALVKALATAFERGARLASICSGVFVLAAAGVLDGKSATTHWRYADLLAQRFPSIKVRPDELYVDEGQAITAAGSAAGLDMLLHLVRRDHGGRVANRVAQRLVLPPHRDGGQAQFVPRPMPSDEVGRLARLMDWVRANPRLPHSLQSLADEAAMSPRSLQRQFTEATGLSPIDWLIRERVALAKDLLEAQDLPMARLAELSGFGSEESLRRHFRAKAGTSPSAYRRRFGHPLTADSAP